ncbi:MAG: phosphodiester glycosidase family protein [Bacteroidales bacterium]|nr:phosphodiester glycosidase family protein [Bacteroidales bacterium]
MRLTLLIPLLLLAAGCSGTPSSDYPEWRWPEKEPAVIDPQEEPCPGIVSLGWTNVTASYSGTGSANIYRSPSVINGNKTVAYIAVAPLREVSWDVAAIDDPAIKGTTEDLKTPSAFYESTAAPVVVNGGYFFAEGGKRYNASVAVSRGRFYGVNINYASLDWETMYYPTRGVFYQDAGASPECGWTYWTGGAAHYLYDEPAPNSWSKDPLQAPGATFPAQARDFSPQTAIGGGPVLIKDGRTVNSWEAELLYGDGADDKMPEERHPRTAIGVTEDGLLILFVCEGRGMTEGVQGMTFAEEAEVLKSLGCVHALNLDGGGSSCMLVNGTETIKPSDGAQRPVASVVVILNHK